MSDSQSKISAGEFKQRLAVLCLKKGGGGLPSKRRDQQILFKSIALTLDITRNYTEAELNDRLQDWLARVGRHVQIDHVSLRRHLVDEGYVVRDPAGRSYRLVDSAKTDRFDPEIESIDPHLVIDEAIRRREERKRQYLGDK